MNAKLCLKNRKPLHEFEHAVNLDTETAAAAEVHSDGEGGTTTLGKTIKATGANPFRVDGDPTPVQPTHMVAGKGYHSRWVSKDLDDSPRKSLINEPLRNGPSWRRGDHEARRALYSNWLLMGTRKSKEAAMHRIELAEHSFQHAQDRGSVLKTWLRGRKDVPNRLLLLWAST